MRWQRGHRSVNVEDRRGSGGMRLPVGRGGAQIGCGGFLLLLLLSVVFQKDFFSLLGGGSASIQAPASQSSPGLPPGEDPQAELVDFVNFLTDDAQAVWAREFEKSNLRYQPAQVVLFSDAVRSACGYARSATGPFYCPADQKIYIDLGFYQELRRRFGAPGDFAQAYVLAHELGHHVQHLLGIDRQVRQEQSANPRVANQLSVRMELQADCLAGVWAASTRERNLLEPGDVEEAMGAAAAIGDDRIQRMSGRYINPESFTHGSSEERMTWFRRGFDSADPDACDTFRS